MKNLLLTTTAIVMMAGSALANPFTFQDIQDQTSRVATSFSYLAGNAPDIGRSITIAGALSDGLGNDDFTAAEASEFVQSELTGDDLSNAYTTFRSRLITDNAGSATSLLESGNMISGISVSDRAAAEVVDNIRLTEKRFGKSISDIAADIKEDYLSRSNDGWNRNYKTYRNADGTRRWTSEKTATADTLTGLVRTTGALNTDAKIDAQLTANGITADSPHYENFKRALRAVGGR